MKAKFESLIRRFNFTEMKKKTSLVISKSVKALTFFAVIEFFFVKQKKKL